MILSQVILARAKKDTDKTDVYKSCIEKINIELDSIQALIIVPTHELALQGFQICFEL